MVTSPPYIFIVNTILHFVAISVIITVHNDPIIVFLVRNLLKKDFVAFYPVT